MTRTVIDILVSNTCTAPSASAAWHGIPQPNQGNEQGSFIHMTSTSPAGNSYAIAVSNRIFGQTSYG